MLKLSIYLGDFFMKLGKEYIVNGLGVLKCKYGTMNKLNPKSIYLCLSCWVCPENVDVKTSTIKKNIKDGLFNSLKPELFDSNKIILNFDVKESGVKVNKRSFMSCEINLYQNENHQIDSEIITSEIYGILKSIKTNLDLNKNFKFYKSKK